MDKKRIKGESGFTLLEIILALAIMAIIAVFSISLATSVRGGVKVSESRNAATEIMAKVKAVYRNTGEMPQPELMDTSQPIGHATNPRERVPTAASALNMETKYRYDAWGTPFLYYAGGGGGSSTDIDMITVDGNPVAGVVISLGPNQRPDFDTSYFTHGDGYIDGVAPTGNTCTVAGTISTEGDDILIPIDVSAEAVEIALEELKVLQDKVKAFDAFYEGINNGFDNRPTGYRP